MRAALESFARQTLTHEPHRSIRREMVRRIPGASTDFCVGSSLVKLLLGIAASVLLVSTTQGQSRATAASSGRGVGPAAHGGGGVRIRIAPRGGRRFFSGHGYFPYFYPDYGYDQEFSEAPPEEIIEQDAAPVPAAPARPPADALMIELQGDHWVRVTNNGQSEIGGDSRESAAQQTSKVQIAAQAPARRVEAAGPAIDVPHAVLVFRDGHQEEIAKYMISGATIYAGADFWNGGEWTRKVQIAELDVPATLKLNQGRGARFTLPSSPDEVMIRP